MTRYFFDVKDKASIQYDYSGRYLRSIAEVKELAALIAIDLGCTAGDASFGTEVQVRDPAGRQLFAVAVQPASALAA